MEDMGYINRFLATFCQFPPAKNYENKLEVEKSCKNNFVQKAAYEMFVKLTPLVNFANSSGAAFSDDYKKSQALIVSRKKASKKYFN